MEGRDHLVHSVKPLRGVVLLPPNTEPGGVRVEAFTDEKLEKPAGVTSTDATGRFAIAIAPTHRDKPLWFRWSRGGKGGRTPLRMPWTPERAPRLACHELGPSAELPAPDLLEHHRGSLRLESGGPAPNMSVLLVEHSAVNARRISEARTARDGSYALPYGRANLLDASADLRVLVVTADGVPLLESTAPDIVIPNELVARAWTDDDAVRDAFALIQALGSALRPEDIEYVLERRPTSRVTRQLLRRAASLASSAEIGVREALAITSAGDHVKPLDSLEAARSVGLLEDTPEIGAVAVAVEAHRERASLRADALHAALDELLADVAKLTRARIARVWSAHKGDKKTLLEKISAIVESNDGAERVLRKVSVAWYTGGYMPLARRLVTGGLSAEELATWERQQWAGFLRKNEVPPPAGYHSAKPAADEPPAEAPIRAYALDLRRTFERAYPKQAIRSHFEQHRGAYPWGDAVHALFAGNPEIDPSTPVVHLSREGGVFAGGANADARRGLATFQRLWRVTHLIDAVPLLVRSGLGSARVIAHMSPVEFVRRFESALGSPEEALAAHGRATRTSELVKLLYAELGAKFDRTALAVLPPPEASLDPNDLATWRQLFGNDDLAFCECAHCKSIFGPSAYLFDMLLFLDRFDVSPGNAQNWVSLGDAAQIRSLGAIGPYLFGGDGDQTIAMRYAAASDAPWLPVISGQELKEKSLAGVQNHLVALTESGLRSGEMPRFIDSNAEHAANTKDIVAIAASGNTIYAANLNGKLFFRSATNAWEAWQQAGRSDGVSGVRALAATDDKLFCVAGNQLFERAAVLGDASWSPIGAPFVEQIVDLTVSSGHLYASTLDNRLLVRPADSSAAAWTPIGHVESPHGLASGAGLLFAVTGNGLVMRDTEHSDRPWVLFGWLRDPAGESSFSVRAMTAAGGRLFATTTDDRLLVVRHPPYEGFFEQWVPHSSGVDAVTVAPDYKRAYAVAGSRLKVREIGPQPAGWDDVDDAPDVRALAFERNQLFATTGSGKLLSRPATKSPTPWQELGPAPVVRDVAVSDGFLYAVTEGGELQRRQLFASDPTVRFTLLDRLRERRPDVPALLLSCDNANIEVPQIDLVNELLGDLVTGTFVERSTTGTSEERRAWPEHEPSAAVLARLSGVARPWTLPYDYLRDRAREARRAIGLDDAGLLEATWQFEELSSSGAAAAIERLAYDALALVPSEEQLLVRPSSTADAWGDKLDSSAPTFEELKAASRLELRTLTRLLETQFVRGAVDGVRLEPEGTCDPHEVRLVVKDQDLKHVLDRMHRLERLRQKTGWSTAQLDAVIAATHGLEKGALIAIGLLIHLAKRVSLGVDELLALFRDPSSNRPHSFADERVVSPFEALFGTAPPPVLQRANDEQILASISQRVGVGADEVQFVLSRGYAHIGGTELRTASDIRTGSKGAWRVAVAAVFRLTTWARVLRLTLPDLVALHELWGRNFLGHASASPPSTLYEQVRDAIGFIALVRDVERWGLSPSEAWYVGTSNQEAARDHGPDPLLVSRVLHRLSEAVKRIREEEAERVGAPPASVADRAYAAVAEIMAEAFELEAPLAAELLTLLLDPADSSLALLRAFVRPDGSTPTVDEALVSAAYERQGARPMKRPEPHIDRDSEVISPPAGAPLNDVHLKLTMPARHLLLRQSSPRRLVVESTGRGYVELTSGGGAYRALTFDGQGSLAREEWNVSDPFLVRSLTSALFIELTVSLENPTGRELRVLIEEGDRLVPLTNPRFDQAVRLFDKAARLVRDSELPRRAWQLLKNLPPERRIDLGALQIAAGRSVEMLQRLAAVERIWARRADPSDFGALESLATGSRPADDALMSLLGVTEVELREIIRIPELAGLGGTNAGTAPAWTWEVLDAVLRISDLARQRGLPLGLVLRYPSAAPADQYAWAVGALRAQRPKGGWLKALQHIHDPVRERLRDALVAWLTAHPRPSRALGTLEPFSTPEAISDFLFTDVQMSACMMSSRVQFGYAAVQKYIDTVRLGFLPGPEVDDQQRFEREWEWRRFYRLWEANRRVFAYPENWLEPDLRPDKSQFFAEFEEELLSHPLDTHSAERAFASYLNKLVQVSRPEIIGIIHDDEMPDATSPIGFRNPDLQGTHVFARNRNEPRELYYRRRLPAPDHRWTPWERIDVELPGTHFVPLIAFRRLFLLAADFGLGQARGAEPTACSPNTQDDPRSRAHLALSYIERSHGRWSRIRRAAPIEFDAASVQFTSTGSISSWADFPDGSFSGEVTVPPPRLHEVNLRFMIGPGDGKPEDLTVRVSLVLERETRELATFGEQAWEPLTSHFHSFPFTPVERSEIRALRVEYNYLGTAGDGFVLKSLEVSFRTIGGENVTSNGHGRFYFTWPGDLGPRYYPGTNDLIPFGGTLEFDITPPVGQSTNYRWEDLKNWFEVAELEWEPPPPDVYALRMDTRISDRIALHLIAQEGVSVHRRLRRKFRFVGYKQYPDAVGKWPQGASDDGWVPGKQQICVPQQSSSAYLRYIEIFADGTIAARLAPGVAPDSPEWTRADDYQGARPWRQSFQAPASWFYTDGMPSVRVPHSHAIVIPAELTSPGDVTSSVTPKVLDEQSDEGEGRTFLVEYAPAADLSAGLGWAFRVHWHGQAAGFLRLLEQSGLPRLLAYQTQMLADEALLRENQQKAFFSTYAPTSIVLTGPDDEPSADVDFSIQGAYADYNWELFFHAPLLVAQRLSEAGQFNDAERWFRRLFDPGMGSHKRPLDSFQTRPLREAHGQRLEDTLKLLGDGIIRSEFEQQVDRLNRFPYQPHLFARSRPLAYQKRLVMKYLDHLIAWGDELFRRAYASDNRTELENAASRYDLVARILGQRPEALPARKEISKRSFDSLHGGRETLDLWDPLVRLEDQLAARNGSEGSGLADRGGGPSGSGSSGLPDHGGAPSGSGSSGLPDHSGSPSSVPNDGSGIPEYLYFCIPHNDVLLRYWDTLAERCGRLRNCRDIEGVRRSLTLYGRQLDPGLLVRATAMGLDIDIILGQLSAPMPRFRFQALVQRARSACDRAQGFSQALLAALEKRDGEELARLRSRHEIALLRAAERVRDEQVDEARESLEALLKSRESVSVRLTFYSTRNRMNAQERAEGEALQKAADHEGVAAGASVAAADRALIPNFPVNAEGWFEYAGEWRGGVRGAAGVSYDFGGRLFSSIEQQKASAATYLAGQNRAEAGRLARQAQYDRRWDDWQLQKATAEKDLQQIDRQITAARIRLRIAEIERENQALQLDQASTVDAYLRDKFTNAQLYRWMESRMSRLYYQQYRLAYDLALKAQHALRYELGLEDETPLPDTWDPVHRGIDAAADLQHELERLDARYIDAWKREHEKTMIFSLADRRPHEFLALLQTGSCEFWIEERDYDKDEPGDFFRRIKHVFVDIPCVRGPDVSVNARLTLLRGDLRKKMSSNEADSTYPHDPTRADDDRFRVDRNGEHVVTSTGVSDAGMHDSSLGGERFLPFEGWGAVSQWRLDLPLDTNHFDRASITDAKLRILYTSRAGDKDARSTAAAARATYMQSNGREILLPIHSYFPDEWARFTRGSSSTRELKITVARDIVPHELRTAAGHEIAEVKLCFPMAGGGKPILGAGSTTWSGPSEESGLWLMVTSSVAFGSSLDLVLDSSSTIPEVGWIAVRVKLGSS